MFFRLIGYLKERDVKFYENFPLSGVSSIKCGGSARFYVLPDSRNKLIEIIRFLERLGIKYKLVGNMTNLLPPDSFFDGVVVSTLELKDWYISDNLAVMQFGCLFKTALARLANKGVSISEELFMIPGTVGAMCACNAGAHGREIKDVFVSAEAYDKGADKIITLSYEDLCFDYRTSSVKGSELILLDCKFSFKRDEKKDICKRIGEFSSLRRTAQPTNLPSLGSFYKRKGGVGMGYYIDKAGIKGFTIGGAQISKKHAGFFVNCGGATAKDFYLLDSYVSQCLFEKYGFIPEREVEFM